MVRSPQHDNNSNDGDDYPLESSARNVASTASGDGSASSGTAIRSVHLRENLTREIQDRDPLFYYEIVSVLGVGSMGSVAKVRKRSAVVGGSARKELREHFRREKYKRDCFSIPLVGGLFRYCLSGVLKSDLSTSGHGGSSGGVTNSSILVPNAPKIDDDDNNNGNKNDNDEDGNGKNNTNNNDDEMIYAMKSIHLKRVTDPAFVEELKNEITILRKLDHPHIIKAMETFVHRNQIFIVMELCTGGDLYCRDPYTEEEAARLVSAILSAISYMHSKNICHRDLKYENIIFANNSPKAEIKLIDFGLSKTFGEDTDMTEGVGTIYTMAPEVIRGAYTKQADIWSIGVIAYMLLSSQMPFYGRKRQHIVEQIIKGKYEFKGRRWRRISQQAKAFVGELLVSDPDDRATAEEAMVHTWLHRRFAATVRNPNPEEVTSAKRSMLKFANYGQLKKLALMVIAHKSTSQQIGILRKVFQKYDTQGKGALSYEQFKSAIADADTGISETDTHRIFDAVDLDGTGKIRYTEFLAATIEAQGAISEERLAEAFDRIDADDSGYISKQNLRDMLGTEASAEEIDQIIQEADIEKDGKISYSEFLALWEDTNERRRSVAYEAIKQMPLNHNDLSTAGSSDDLSNTSSTADDNHGGVGGDGDVDVGDAADDVEKSKRSTFLSVKKQASERQRKQQQQQQQRQQAKAGAAGEKSPAAGSGKQVLFRDSVQTIPNVIVVDDNQADDGHGATLSTRSMDSLGSGGTNTAASSSPPPATNGGGKKGGITARGTNNGGSKD